MKNALLLVAASTLCVTAGSIFAFAQLPPDASFKPDAKMNFFVSNGPVMLAAFSDVPYCYLMTQYAGSQGPARYPWASDNQRIFYLGDTAANLARIWEEIDGSRL